MRFYLALEIFSHPKIIYAEGGFSGAGPKETEKGGRESEGRAERASAGVWEELHLR